jgi:hydroxymethylglutaryl-CoA lyase
MTARVRITEVAPRDGLQNEPGVIPTADKGEMVRLLGACGVDEVEITSLVSPKWVPQLGDAAELLAMVASERPAGVCLSVLVPNEKGMERAMASDRAAGGALIDKVSVMTAASESFSLKNTNASIEESIRRLIPVIASAHGLGKRTRGYVSCVVRCPYEGEIDPGRVGEICARLVEAGVDELDLGDTIGAGTPETIAPPILEAIEALDGRASNDFGEPTLTVHLHDTFGNASACVREALNLGVRSFDASAAGLGGCPFASVGGGRAPGNIATELLVRTIEDAGFGTGVNRARLAHASAFAERVVSRARLEAAGGGGA